jgi:hypothetical protein
LRDHFYNTPTYIASHDPQGRSREVHFGHRDRGAKIGPFKECRGGEGGNECRKVEKWRLKTVLARRKGLKRVKAARRLSWSAEERELTKTAPKLAVFCRLALLAFDAIREMPCQRPPLAQNHCHRHRRVSVEGKHLLASIR